MRGLRSMLIVGVVTLVAAPLLAQETTAEPIGDWRYVLNPDEMTDEPNPYVFTTGRDSDREGLSFICAAGSLTVLVIPERLLLTDRRDRVRVMWRVDREEASSEDSWSATMRAANSSGRQAVELFQAARDGERLTVRVRDRRTSQTMAYSLTGMEDAVRRLPCAPGE